HGSAVAFFSRLLPVVRTYISLPAGIARMDFLKFSMYTLLGSLPWCLALAWVGTKLGENSAQLSSVFHGLDVVIGVVLVAAVALSVWRHVPHDTLARARQTAGASSAATSPARRRQQPLPTSPFDTDERPTVPVEGVPSWPNRFARPHQNGG